MKKSLNPRSYIIILLSICLVLNLNTFKNEYALDDAIAITNNLNVQAGFAGIKTILTTDAFQGYFDMMDAEAATTGGRYRPLSIVSFAIEQQLFGVTLGDEFRKQQKEILELKKNKVSENELAPHYQKLTETERKMLESNNAITTHRHFVQLLFYLLLIFVMFRFLEKHVFSGNAHQAFLTTLLFVVHPVHAEVIANLKSRDEIFSLLFSILCLHFSFDYLKNKTRRNLLYLLLFFVLALLSKEYAMILPFIIIIGWYSNSHLKLKELINPASKGLFGLLLAFVFIRFSVFGNTNNQTKITDVLNDPYLYATAGKAFASKVAILIEYLRVLFFPRNLSSDYSYSHFAYSSILSPKFLISLLLYIGMFVMFIRLFIQRHKLLFPFALFLGFLMLINNLLFGIGATMGERLIFHSSFGWCIIVVSCLSIAYYKLRLSVGLKKVIFFSFGIAVVTLFSFKTIERNREWKNDYTLFTADVKTVPNSALANANAGSELYNAAFADYQKDQKDTAQFKKRVHEAIAYFDQAIQIYPNYITCYQNRGLCYFNLTEEAKAAADWTKAADIYKQNNLFLTKKANYFLNKGMAAGSQNDFKYAVRYLEYAAGINPFDAGIWNNLGGAYFKSGQFINAIAAFDRSLSIDPNYPSSMNGKTTSEAIYKLEQQYVLDKTNTALSNELTNAYKTCGVEVSVERLDK